MVVLIRDELTDLRFRTRALISFIEEDLGVFVRDTAKVRSSEVVVDKIVGFLREYFFKSIGLAYSVDKVLIGVFK